MTDIRIPETDEELLEECDVDTFCSSGKGGQNVNRRETAVRLRHRPSGLTVICQQERRQYRNKQIALSRLRIRLKNLTRRRRFRVPTAMPRGVREKILEQKKHISLKKKARRKPDLDD
ncbi:MAG: peptide chain release factor-like protein [Candidatus Omnitrophica bacterium]|nr:peptide chain release factor-like protein [Candidatus Omnitrophota bacterium]